MKAGLRIYALPFRRNWGKNISHWQPATPLDCESPRAAKTTPAQISGCFRGKNPLCWQSGFYMGRGFAVATAQEAGNSLCSCVMSRAREKTDSLTAHRVYHGCCPWLEHGLAGLMCKCGMAGLCKAAALASHSHRPHCARGRRETKSLLQELTVCVAPGPI